MNWFRLNTIYPKFLYTTQTIPKMAVCFPLQTGCKLTPSL